MNCGCKPHVTTVCAAIVLTFLLGGCASNAGTSAVDDDRAARATATRCPVGFTMVCETKKVGRIQFGRMGKDNLESCSCEPESFSAGRSQQPALPR